MAAGRLPPKNHIERFFADNQFSAKYLLSCSDVQPLTQKEVLAMADPECRQLWEDLSLGYTEPQGHPLLRQEAARLHGVQAGDILTAAPQEAIYVAMNCLIPYLKQRWNLEQLHVISTFPAFQSLYENARTLYCDVDFWKAKLTDKGWDFDFSELKQMVKPNTRLIVVNFPHNPTGFHPSAEEFNGLIQFCRSKEIFLFSDEMYKFTNNDGSKPLPSPPSVYDDSITLFGVSKTTAGPGLRLGWLVTRNKDLLKMMIMLKDYLSLCAAAPAEILTIIILRNLDKVIKRSMDIVHKNLDLLDHFFATHPDIFEWHRPPSCTITLVKIKGWITELREGGAEGFTKSLREDAQIMLAPSNLFEMEDEYVRVGFGRCNLPQVLEQLQLYLDKH